MKNIVIQAYLNWSEPIKITANNSPDKALVVSSFNVYIINLLIIANIGFLSYFHNLGNRCFHLL